MSSGTSHSFFLTTIRSVLKLARPVISKCKLVPTSIQIQFVELEERLLQAVSIGLAMSISFIQPNLVTGTKSAFLVYNTTRLYQLL